MQFFRLDKEYEGGLGSVVSRPFARAFTESSPHVKGGMIMTSWNSEVFYYVEHNGERQNYQDAITGVTSGVTRVFHFDMVEGNETALDQPETAIIPESMARRLFGNESAMGKRLMSVETGNTLYTISGVLRTSLVTLPCEI